MSATRALTLVAVLFCASPAHAYRTFADDPEVGYPARWTVQIEWQLGAAPPGLDDAGWEAAATAAFAAWESTGCVPASTMTRSDADAVAADGLSSVVVITSGWSARGYPDRAAFTEVVLRSEPGVVAVAEADVYLNAESYRFVTSGGEGVDVQGVLVHEVGHLLGMLHSCGEAAAPACEGAFFAASVMNPTYRGEAGRALGADDALGICALYTPSACSEPGGCRASCDDTTPCGEGVCAVAGASAGTCVIPMGPGAECGRGEECDTGLCVTSASRGSYCTTACRDDSECGVEETCTLFGARAACAPRVGGCSAAPGPSRGPHFALVGLGLMLLSFRRRTLNETETR